MLLYIGGVSFSFSSIRCYLFTAHTAEYCQHLTSTSRNSTRKHAFATGESVNIDRGANIPDNNMKIKMEREGECGKRFTLIG